jgi:hypothetical protein
MNAQRERLPNRRASTSFNFEVDGLRYTAMYPRFDDGRLAELFLTNHKCENASDTNARDASITMSIALQHGADPDVIRHALCRDSQGRPSGPLAKALDLILASSTSEAP